MLKKITIPPVPIIIIGRPKIDGFMPLDYNFYYNNIVAQKIKYPQDKINFSEKIGKTQYDVSTCFDSASKLSVLNQFKSFILKNNLI